MAYIKSRKHAIAHALPPLSTAAAATLIALSAPVSAQTAPASSSSLGEIKVEATTEYKTDNASSPKYTAPLLDTPQTITVVPSVVLEQQNSLSLQEALTNNVPGITFQAGEGGGGYGDNIVLRGFNASNNITLDGVRDSGQYTRSDFFNIDGIEVTNGANSVYGGAGNISGGINLISKMPKAEDFTRLSGGLGTDSYGRGTIDLNRLVGETTGIRLNAMIHKNDVPDRDVESFKRWGIAPSITFGLNTPTKFTLSYFHQTDDNIPQFGVPYANTPFINGPIPYVARNNYYAYRNIDNREELSNDRLAGIFEHRFSDAVSVRNYTQIGRTDRLTQVDAIRGTWCLPNGINPRATTAAQLSCATPDTFLPNDGPHGYVRDETNDIISNQTDLTAKFATGGVQHTMVAGLALYKEEYDLTAGGVLNFPDGTPVPANSRTPMSVTNPQGIWVGPLNYFSTSKSKGEQKSVAGYLFDDIKFNEQWSINGGMRYEHASGNSQSTSSLTPAGVETWGTRFENSDNLFSYRIGAVYKPAQNGSIYAAYGNSKTPSMANVRGSCNDTSCAVAPETAVNFEIGTKWDVLDNRLSLTGAIFRNELQNYKVNSGDPFVPEQQLDGKARVDGVALGAAGQITREWGIFANYTYLKSKVLQSVSDQVLATTGIDAQAGNPLTQTPEHAANLWTTYEFLPGWTIGYGINYVGSYYLNNGAPPLYKAPDYTVQNAMLGWRVSKNFDLQLNIKNLTDREYYTRIRSSEPTRFAVPGAGRSFTITANYTY